MTGEGYDQQEHGRPRQADMLWMCFVNHICISVGVAAACSVQKAAAIFICLKVFHCLQVVEPDASKKDVYEAAFARHYQIGIKIFEQ